MIRKRNIHDTIFTSPILKVIKIIHIGPFEYKMTVIGYESKEPIMTVVAYLVLVLRL